VITQEAPTQPRTRAAAVDAVRVIGVVAIVVGHTWNFDYALYTWHVPVFFFLSGYLWRSGRSLREEVRRRARTLLVPYVSWLVIVTAIWVPFMFHVGLGYLREPTGDLLRGGWFIARPYSAFWFITALFVSAVAMRALERVSSLLPWVVGAAAVAWSTVAPDQIKRVPEAAGIALVGLFCMCVGQLVRRHRARIRRPVEVGLLLLVPSYLLGFLHVLEPLNVKAGELGTPVLSLLMSLGISCGLLLVLEGLEPHLPEQVGRAATLLASVSVPVILGHALVLGVFQRLHDGPSVPVVLVALLLPTAVGFLLRPTPLRALLL
jgi:acyltransferase